MFGRGKKDVDVKFSDDRTILYDVWEPITIQELAQKVAAEKNCNWQSDEFWDLFRANHVINILNCSYECLIIAVVV